MPIHCLSCYVMERRNNRHRYRCREMIWILSRVHRRVIKEGRKDGRNMEDGIADTDMDAERCRFVVTLMG